MLGSVFNALGIGSSGGGGGGGQCVDGESYVKASEKAQTAMELVATINTVAATAIAIRQLTLANKYFDLAKEARDYWKGTFKPLEVELVNEVKAMPMYTPQFDVTSGRWLATVKQQFKHAYDVIGNRATRYCTGLTASMMRDAAVAQANTEGDVINMAYRYEEGRKQIFDEVRHSRRNQAVALGRDMISVSSSYAGQAFNAYGNLRDWTMGNANGALRNLHAMRTVSRSPYDVDNGVAVQGTRGGAAGSGQLGTQPSHITINDPTTIPGYNRHTGVTMGSQATAAAGTFTSLGATFNVWGGMGTPHNVGGNAIAPGSPMGAVPYGSTPHGS